jgi:hypothetical protein
LSFCLPNFNSVKHDLSVPTGAGSEGVIGVGTLAFHPSV